MSELTQLTPRRSAHGNVGPRANRAKPCSGGSDAARDTGKNQADGDEKRDSFRARVAGILRPKKTSELIPLFITLLLEQRP
jgi:hypothetical protein